MALITSIKVGSRSSPLSVAQTEEVLSPLRLRFPDIEFQTVRITTDGDRKKEAPLLSLGRGVFAKEIERALLAEEIDLAVHSAKDLATTLPDGLTIAATGPRKDPRDVQVNRWGLPLMRLPPHARLATSSPRRAGQLLAMRLDLQVVPIRGNVGSRLDRLRDAEYDGVVLAAAGLARLNRQAAIAERFPPESFTPAVGQGILAVEARDGDRRVMELLARIDHHSSSVALRAEREFLLRLGGGCKVPVAAYARVQGQELHISAMAVLPDGSQLYRTETVGGAADPGDVGARAAEALLSAGAHQIV